MTRERMNNEVITNEVANAVELNITKIEYGTQSWDIPTGWSIAEVVEAAQQLTVGISNPITANTGYDLVTDETTGTTKVVFHVPQTQNFGTKGTDDEVPAETPVEETGTVELNITKIEYGTQSWDIPAGWSIADVVEAAKQLTTGISNPITDNTGYDLVTDDVTGTTKVVFHVPQTQNFGTKGTDDVEELNITKIEYGTQSWDIPAGWSIADVVEAAKQLTTGISNPITDNTGYDLVADDATGTTKVVFHVPQTQNFGTKGTDDEVPAETPVEETGTVELNITKIEYGTQSWDIPAGWSIADVVEAAKQLTTGISNPITNNTGYDLVTDDVTGTTKVVFHVPQTQNFGTKGICA